MKVNPYETPKWTQRPFPTGVREHRITSYVLAAFAIVIGAVHLRPFITSPIAMWDWQNWWFGFAPAAYLVVAAIIAVICERWPNRFGYAALPFILLPLLVVTGLIGFATYIDLPNIVAGDYGLAANLHSLLLISVCPVIWYYLVVTSARLYRSIRSADH